MKKLFYFVFTVCFSFCHASAVSAESCQRHVIEGCYSVEIPEGWGFTEEEVDDEEGVTVAVYHNPQYQGVTLSLGKFDLAKQGFSGSKISLEKITKKMIEYDGEVVLQSIMIREVNGLQVVVIDQETWNSDAKAEGEIAIEFSSAFAWLHEGSLCVVAFSPTEVEVSLRKSSDGSRKLSISGIPEAKREEFAPLRGQMLQSLFKL